MTIWSLNPKEMTIHHDFTCLYGETKRKMSTVNQAKTTRNFLVDGSGRRRRTSDERLNRCWCEQMV